MADLVQIRGRAPAAPNEADRPDSPRVYLETFGCQMNEADSGLIAGRLHAAGYRRVTDPAGADVILINTCAVREKAEDRVWGRTSQLLAHRRENPGLVIGITGCMAEHLKDRVSERAPHVTLVAGPDRYRDIAALVDRARAGERVIDTQLDRDEVYEGLDPHAGDDESSTSAYVTVQRGCDKFCTFCVVPYTRGRERGVPPGEVLRAVRARVQQGAREVVLLGQTVNSYRHEDVSFADLVRAIHEIPGLARIRFTSPYPVDFTDELVRTMAELPKVCPQVHLPVQSGSDRVLERMRRGYDRGAFLKLVDRLRTAIPDVALSTDLLVGFCGETEEDHAQTLALVEEVRFDAAFMFAYSDRGITYAARKLVDDVPPEVKQRRLHEVIERQEVHTRRAHDRRVGTHTEILLGGPSRRGDHRIGRSPHLQNVLVPLSAGQPGELLPVEITASTGHSLRAVPLDA